MDEKNTGKDFLSKMKESLESGEFNSEVADKFNNILDLSQKKSKLGSDKLSETINKRLDEAGYKQAESEEEVEKSKKEFDDKMYKIKVDEQINRLHAELINDYTTLLKVIENLANNVKDTEKVINELEQDIKDLDSVKQTIETIKKIKESLT